MRVLAVAGSVLMLVASTEAAPTLPTVVAKDLAENVSLCTDAGGKANTDAAVKRADLTGDGRDDYVLDVGSINCEGAASIYGDREKAVLVYVADAAGGAKNAFAGMNYGVRLEGTGPAAKLWLTTSGADCGMKQAADFASESFCERYIVWNAKTQKFDYAPIGTIKTIE
jgi:hypothetical protein